jgi:transcriptional regulator CtsR
MEIAFFEQEKYRKIAAARCPAMAAAALFPLAKKPACRRKKLARCRFCQKSLAKSQKVKYNREKGKRLSLFDKRWIMGNSLADFIERCILGKFAEARERHILMRRNDLAVELSCAPSQISYVLNTRFTPERGFVVKSRRGAGGFVRIVQVLPKIDGPEATRLEAMQVLERLLDVKVISGREYALLRHFMEVSAAGLDSGGRLALLSEALKRMGVDCPDADILWGCL